MFRELTPQFANGDDSSDRTETRHARLVVEAECTTCGPLCAARGAEAAAIRAALAHTGKTGHVVVLNGTTDLPENDPDDAPSLAIYKG